MPDFGYCPRNSRWLHTASGVILIAIGIAMMTGKLTVFAYWLLEAFPVLGGLG